jgi:epoxyqueuosine reductase
VTRLDSATVKQLALDSGFDLVGIAAAEPLPEAAFYLDWVRRGQAASMTYLADHRAGKRLDPRDLLRSARSIVCCGVLYNTRHQPIASLNDPTRAWISRYAWGDDYHDVLTARFKRLLGRLLSRLDEPFEYKICVDTAPILERAYAQRAGLGWIGKNTCLINEPLGSWFFLGEMLLALPLEPDSPSPPRCGTCTACIEACPTAAIVPTGLSAPEWELVPDRCLSFHTIESRETPPQSLRSQFSSHVFGCDICQDVCPWNRRAPATDDSSFAPREYAPPLEKLASLSEQDFREMFRASPILRAKHRGFLRNVAIAMGNAPREAFRQPLLRLAEHHHAIVREAAHWALARLDYGPDQTTEERPRWTAGTLLESTDDGILP